MLVVFIRATLQIKKMNLRPLLIKKSVCSRNSISRSGTWEWQSLFRQHNQPDKMALMSFYWSRYLSFKLGSWQIFPENLDLQAGLEMRKEVPCLWKLIETLKALRFYINRTSPANSEHLRRDCAISQEQRPSTWIANSITQQRFGSSVAFPPE